jgi:prefoldin beta subunit
MSTLRIENILQASYADCKNQSRMNSNKSGRDENDLNQRIQELQILEHNLQQLLMEKQTLQVELNEVSQALEEVKKSTGDIYKVLSGVMLLADKKIVGADLEERKKVLELRLKSLDKQESLVGEKTQKLRSDINNSVVQKKQRE